MNIEEEVEQSKKVHDPTRNALLHVIRKRNLKVGIEIGVQYGLNAESILENTGIEKLYGIDPYDTSFYPISPLKGKDEEIYQHAMKRLERFGDRYEHIRKPSNDALLDIEGEIDFLYIDGGKTKGNIVDDFTLWYPKIKMGGIMSGNDYNHSSYPWITRFLNQKYSHVNAGPADLWWVHKNPSTNPTKISVVTPFYNTSVYANEMIESVVRDPRIDEMIIVDDCSEKEDYERLVKIAEGKPKVKIFRNEENLGEFKTRIIGTEKARNQWVIFLDGDNSLTPEYIDAISNIPCWREQVIYCPDDGIHPKINYTFLDACYLGIDNIKYHIDKEVYQVKMFLGTGNYFMNKKAYLKVAKPLQEVDKRTYGDFYFNAEWLKKNLMYIVKGMKYNHRIRKNSAWMENKHTIQPFSHKVMAELVGEKQCNCKHCERKRR